MQKLYMIQGIFSIMLGIFIAVTLFKGSIFMVTKQSVPPRLQAVSSPSSIPTTPTQAVALKPVPSQYQLAPSAYVSQSFNNCGPASLSMLLARNGKPISQVELAEKMRPLNNPNGGFDDKSVFPQEFVYTAKEYGFEALHRPHGNVEMVKTLLAHDIPVVVRTWLKLDDDIGHYRVVKGYTENGFIHDDSYQGPNIQYSIQDFETMWKPYNYEYIIVYSKDKEEIVKAILKDDFDETTAWKNTYGQAQAAVYANSDDTYAIFDLAVASYHLGKYDETVRAYEQVASKISPHTLWYQIEPVQAYLKLKQYDKVLSTTSQVMNTGNRAYSEFNYLRGKSYAEQGMALDAQAEFAKAYEHNKNFDKVKEAMGL